MNSFLLYLISGTAIGSTLAFLPSPLLALLVNETIKYGKSEGIKIALVPSLTDIPVISVSLFIMVKIDDMNLILGFISICGAVFLSYIGIKSFLSHGINIDTKEIKPQSIKKGIITNFLNPNPYIFWFTVGTPAMIAGWNINPAFPAVYIAGFFSSLIGIRIIMSVIVSRSIKFLNSKSYLIVSKILSIILILFGLKLLLQGFQLMIK